MYVVLIRGFDIRQRLCILHKNQRVSCHWLILMFQHLGLYITYCRHCWGVKFGLVARRNLWQWYIGVTPLLNAIEHLIVEASAFSHELGKLGFIHFVYSDENQHTEDNIVAQGIRERLIQVKD